MNRFTLKKVNKMKTSHKKIMRYIYVIIISILILLVAGSYLIRYNVKPNMIYLIDSENLINDSSFENFNQTAGDCCNGLPGNASIFATKSNESYLGNYSLNLTAFNHCACIKISFTNFSISDIYLLNFYYKGDKAKICNWVGGDNKCISSKEYNGSVNWILGNTLFYFTNFSTSASIFFYADSRDGTPVTNLYDDLQVHRLDPLDWDEVLDMESFNQEAIDSGYPEAAEVNQYVILTKKDNLVHNGEFLSDSTTESGFAYYLVTGKPEITLKFPYTEVIIIIILAFIIIRLVFSKTEEERHEDFAKKIRKDIEGKIKFSRKEEILDLSSDKGSKS
jgi:hypothetical protein